MTCAGVSGGNGLRSDDNLGTSDGSQLPLSSQPSPTECPACGRPAFMSPDPPFDLLCQSCGVRSPSASSASAAPAAQDEGTAATRVVQGDGEADPAGDPPQDGRGREVGWHALLLLLGAETSLAYLWQMSGLRYDVGGGFLSTAVLLALAPVVTIRVALRLGWIDRRPRVGRWLVGLALVGPVLLGLSLLLDAHLFALSPLVATPASIAVAAGLVGGLRSRAGRASVLFLGGAVLGFVVPAWTLIELGIGSLGFSLPEENITAVSIIAEMVLACFVLPALGAGSVLGHRIRDRSGTSPMAGSPGPTGQGSPIAAVEPYE